MESTHINIRSLTPFLNPGGTTVVAEPNGDPIRKSAQAAAKLQNLRGMGMGR